MREKGAQWLVTLARPWCTSATSVPPFSHPERYLVLGTPTNYFADLGAILAIFGHFWAGKKMGFFAEKWHFGPDIRAESQNHR